ncbi:MAG: hypothetical protein AABW91_00835, partial [Nanoarchaeota archaeon]
IIESLNKNTKKKVKINKTLAGIISASAIGLASLGFSGCDTVPATYNPYPPVYQPAPIYRSPIIIRPYEHHHPRNIYINPRPYIHHRPIPIRPLRPHPLIGPHHRPHGGPFR